MTMRILAIDPGTTESAWVVWDERTGLREFYLKPNGVVLAALDRLGDTTNPQNPTVLVIESIESYGMSVGKSTFATCYWIGRFWERWAWRHADDSVILLPRLQIKMAICHNSRAKDPNIRQALIDRLGPVGTKANCGPLYGVKKHMWSALAAAVAYCDGARPPEVNR